VLSKAGGRKERSSLCNLTLNISRAETLFPPDNRNNTNQHTQNMCPIVCPRMRKLSKAINIIVHSCYSSKNKYASWEQEILVQKRKSKLQEDSLQSPQQKFRRQLTRNAVFPAISTAASPAWANRLTQPARCRQRSEFLYNYNRKHGTT